MSVAQVEASDVKLVSSWFCPFAQRAWIALEEKGVNYQYVEVDPYEKPPELMSVNPRGLVPALDHGGIKLYESMVVMEYIDEAFSGPKLMPETPADRAIARIWMDFANRKVVPTYYRLLQRQDPESQKSEAAALLKQYEEISAAMVSISPNGPFFFGEQFGLVDITLAPWAAVRQGILEHYRNFQLPEHSPALDRFHQWVAAVLEHPSVKATLQDKQKLLDKYKRYAENTATSEVAIAVNSGTTLP